GRLSDIIPLTGLTDGCPLDSLSHGGHGERVRSTHLAAHDLSENRCPLFGIMRLVGPVAYCSSSRKRSRRSSAALSETTNRSASPALAVWLAKVQCGMVNTSCCDHSKVCSPTTERPEPDTTRQIMLQVLRLGRVATPLGRRTAWQSSVGITASPVTGLT